MIEFKDIASVNEVLSSACFVNTNIIAPVQSPVLWFRKGQLTSSRNQKTKLTKNKFTKSDYTCFTDTEIARKLYQAKSVILLMILYVFKLQLIFKSDL